MPILLAPGTAVTGSQTYAANFQKLMNNSDIYDPIPMDIPDSLLDDIQSNAEYHAYAINYVGSITNRQVGMVTWSQGSLDMQWALKYWPSTRPVVSDFVAISPDLNGTTVFGTGSYFENVEGIIPLAPALLQQLSESVFIKTLRANGGDSAYVPTTTIYSNADDIVSPQEGTNASGIFKSDNAVQTMNYQLQTICPNQTAGGNFTHKEVLYNSFAVAIAMDAFANPGPGDATRLDLVKVCGLAVAEGLDENDKELTQNITSQATGNLLAGMVHLNVQETEPAIRAYATKDVPVGYVAPSIFKTMGTGIVAGIDVIGDGIGSVLRE